MAYRSLCVTDTNVWIDLHTADLSDLIFRLPLRLLAPDVIVSELERPPGKDLTDRGLIVRELTGTQVGMVAQLAARYLQPSRTDLFALVLAQEDRAILLTGDRHLRLAAEQEGVEVHGTLWILDQMVNSTLLDPQDAARRLLQMEQAGRRLPAEEVKQRLKIWSGAGSA